MIFLWRQLSYQSSHHLSLFLYHLLTLSPPWLFNPLIICLSWYFQQQEVEFKSTTNKKVETKSQRNVLMQTHFSDIRHLVGNIKVLCEQNMFITENNISVNDLVLEASVNPSVKEFPCALSCLNVFIYHPCIHVINMFYVN